MRKKYDFRKENNFDTEEDFKWALFFHMCKLEWEYKPNVFRIGKGIDVYFTPTFVIHDVRIQRDNYHIVKDLYIIVLKGNATKEDEKMIEIFAKEHAVYIVGRFPKEKDINEIDERMIDRTDYLYNLYYVDGDWFGGIPGIDNEENFCLFGGEGSYICQRDDKNTQIKYDYCQKIDWEKEYKIAINKTIS